MQDFAKSRGNLESSLLSLMKTKLKIIQNNSSLRAKLKILRGNPKNPNQNSPRHSSHKEESSLYICRIYFFSGFFSHAMHAFRMTNDRLCVMDCFTSFAMTRNVVIATYYFVIT
ncbi:hypothetical protein [Helicobacter fennelliae]|uniref:hypothetical protein n=1 Tax=Helicobacter fennelliae TaxID=215 RepID=UPI0011C038F7|nr:hypothetical protein [Helicobacter fennelliae]